MAVENPTGLYYLEEAYQNIQPLSFTIADKTYTNIVGTENFLCENDTSQSHWTPTQILKRHTGTYYLSNSNRETISMPAPAFLISASGRQRIMRSFLYNRYKGKFPIFPKQILEFLEGIPQGDGASSAKREFLHCLWATGYNHEAAAALLITTGLSSKKQTTENSVNQAAIYTLTQQPDGITLIITDETNIQDRYDSACSVARHRAVELRSRSTRLNKSGKPMLTIVESMILDVCSEAMQALFYYNKTYLSLPREYSNIYRTAIREFVENLFSATLALDEINDLDAPEVPDILEWESPETYFIAYDDFRVTGRNTIKNQQQGFYDNYENIISKAKENNLSYDELYTTTFLRTIYNVKSLESAKKNGLIVKEKNRYRIVCLAEDFLERS